ncbi:hypothetical protein AK812_SmicGene14584 [Symbiodinium microadriaticum]|uniref:Pentatricopeptide repeat-containing protein, chloroplastic n=1 Tax=Symbiodinium microadriaticum TaxID=2951 RepID=A0A1Q9E588_SYMMI|nr:hypothetical protein AK812_SmicGene14584 [Symbiodinium microadriaticum]
MPALGAALAACERGSQWHIAAALLEDFHLQLLSPDDGAAASVLSACGKAGRWPAACQLFEALIRTKDRGHREEDQQRLVLARLSRKKRRARRPGAAADASALSLAPASHGGGAPVARLQNLRWMPTLELDRVRRCGRHRGWHWLAAGSAPKQCISCASSPAMERLRSQHHVLGGPSDCSPSRPSALTPPHASSCPRPPSHARGSPDLHEVLADARWGLKQLALPRQLVPESPMDRADPSPLQRHVPRQMSEKTFAVLREGGRSASACPVPSDSRRRYALSKRSFFPANACGVCFDDIYVDKPPARTPAVLSRFEYHLLTSLRIPLHADKASAGNSASVRPPQFPPLPDGCSTWAGHPAQDHANVGAAPWARRRAAPTPFCASVQHRALLQLLWPWDGAGALATGLIMLFGCQTNASAEGAGEPTPGAAASKALSLLLIR